MSPKNELIAECSHLVRQHVFGERKSAMCYAVIVHSTPDSSHVELTTFLFRYLTTFLFRYLTTFLFRYLFRHESRFDIVKRFLKFVDYSDETGSEIAQMNTETLESHAIPVADCRAQGYDNAASMSGKHNGAQATIIIQQCPTATFPPCGCHSLDLCRNEAAEYIPEAITYFDTIQTIYSRSNHLF